MYALGIHLFFGTYFASQNNLWQETRLKDDKKRGIL